MNLFKFKKEKGFTRTPKLVHGFTLVESLVAVSILSISILASFGAVSTSLQNSTTNKEQITAFFLIQDGMELIKNIRDENALISIGGGSNTWLSSLAAVAGDPCYFGKTCRIEGQPTSKTITYCGVAFGSCPVLKQDSGTYLYGYTTGWTDTIYKREIQFTSVSAYEVKVTIRVSWTLKGQSKYVEVTQSLFDRQ